MHSPPLTTQAASGKVLVTMDGWSADNTKMLFQGMSAHWIEVKDGRWKMRASMIGFKGLSGAHSGENLGRYAVELFDCVGIMNNKESKVKNCYRNPKFKFSHTCSTCQLYMATLDNTRNNSTTCKTIETIHNHRGLDWNSNEQQLLYVISSLIFVYLTIRQQLPSAHCQSWQCWCYEAYNKDHSCQNGHSHLEV